MADRSEKPGRRRGSTLISQCAALVDGGDDAYHTDVRDRSYRDADPVIGALVAADA